MVGLGLKFRIRKSELERQIREEVKRRGSERVRRDFGRFRPFIAEAINDGVRESSNFFIPSQRRVYALGIGEGGSIDHEKLDAWKQLLVESFGSNEIVQFSITKSGSNRRGLIGTIEINVDEEALLNSDLARIETPDSDKIDEIPWLRWFIEGKTVSTHRFLRTSKPRQNSRTGGGIMVEGGLWTIPPRPATFRKLSQNILKNLRGSIRKNIGSIVRGS